MEAKTKIVKTGTSGYSYEDWRNVFYSADLPKGKMLEFYARYFNTVEINASYYRIPDQSVFRRMDEKTPAEFEFIVKANRESTHRRLENEAALKQLMEAVKPLIESEKFYGFLAQFPYSFKNYEKNRKYLIQIKNIVGDLPIFVEFRNSSWVNPGLPDFLRQNNIGYVNVDEPCLPGLLPKQSIVSSESAYIRFHGRNEKDWWNGQGSARYNYEYEGKELKEWMTHLSDILKKTYKTYVFFNNHPNGQAIKNAQQMMKILEDQFEISF